MLVQVPNLVYHGWKCISPEPALVVNVPDRAYQRRRSRRVPARAARLAALRLVAQRWLRSSSPAAPASSAPTSSATRSPRIADWHVTTLDKLTYAGRLENLQRRRGNPRHTFVKGDVADAAVAAPLVAGSDIVVHFAAETHVDRSLMSAGEFITTDVFGTFVLLEAAREAPELRRFVQISTDEVYGSVAEGSSRETDELRPRNPYSASKAGADRLAYSYWATYDVPVVITRASNNYGPYQFPEKVIPLFITNAIDDLPLPLYGDGLQRARLAPRRTITAARSIC